MSESVTFQLPSNIYSTDGKNTVQLDVARKMIMRELSANENLTKQLPEGHKIKFEFNGKVVEPSETLESIGYFDMDGPKQINVTYELIPDFQAGKVHAYFFVYNDKRKQVVVSNDVVFNHLLNYIKKIFGIAQNDEITLGTRNSLIQDTNMLFNVLTATDIQVSKVSTRIKGGRRRSSASAAKKRASARRGRGSSAKKRASTRRQRHSRRRRAH